MLSNEITQKIKFKLGRPTKTIYTGLHVWMCRSQGTIVVYYRNTQHMLTKSIPNLDNCTSCKTSIQQEQCKKKWINNHIYKNADNVYHVMNKILIFPLQSQ
jgi:hypothetical protein